MTRPELRLRIGLMTFLLIVTTLYLIEAQGFHHTSQWTPQLAGGSAAILLIIGLVRDLYRYQHLRASGEREYEHSMEHSMNMGQRVTGDVLLTAGKYLLWVAGFILGIWLLSFMVAAPTFLAAFLFVDAKAKPRLIAIAITGTIVALVIFRTIVGFTWPGGVLVSL